MTDVVAVATGAAAAAAAAEDVGADARRLAQLDILEHGILALMFTTITRYTSSSSFYNFTCAATDVGTIFRKVIQQHQTMTVKKEVW